MSIARELFEEADKRLKRSRVNRVIDGNGEERTDCIVITPEMREAARRRGSWRLTGTGRKIHLQW